MPSKERLRDRFKQVRMDLTDRYRRTASRAIHRRIFELPELRSAKLVAVYLSKSPEVETLDLLPKFSRYKKTVAAPRVLGEKLQFHRLKKGLQDCRPGYVGIPEPKPSCPKIPAKKLKVILVPGIVFDEKGYRLGYGKGFYDRFLSKNPRLVTIGLSYEKTLVSGLPAARHDIPVHIIVTEKRVLRIPKRRP